MPCRVCGTHNPDAKNFCGDCGAALSTACPHCNAANPLNKKFYGDCGAALPTAGLAADAAPQDAAKTARPHLDNSAGGRANIDGERDS
jgi:Double zinc ribbon